MRKTIITALIAAITLSMSGIASATMLIPASDQAKEHAQAAPEHSPAIDESWGLEKVDFIHYAKPENPAKSINPARPAKTESCYKLMGVKWPSLPVNYAINPANSQSLDNNFIATAIFNAAETWDAATSRELFDNAYSIDGTAQYGLQDYENTIAFGAYPDSKVIAVTSVWYTRVGKRIVEFDMLFNTSFNWGDATADNTLMDLQNIATHELGHAVGLSDIYSTTCTEVTMYGYSGEGDTAKRSLEQPDIKGLVTMYGL